MEIDSYLSEKQKKRKRWRRYVFFAVVFLIVYIFFVGALWVLLRSPLFRVDAIVVQGNATVPRDDVVTLLQSSALRDHDFFKALLGFRNILMWPSSLGASDLRFVPQIAAIKISKNYGTHTITASVTERVPFAIWCVSPAADERCYWFDATGIAFRKTFDTQGSLMFSIHDYSEDSVGLGGKVLSDPFMDNLISIINVVKESGVGVKEVSLKDIGLQEIDMTTYDGPDVYFSLRFPADNDLGVLQSLMAKPGFGKLQYVDLRVENRAYYK
jgi:hypothetical protein